MSKDPFALDSHHRSALADEIGRVRVACADAVAEEDAEAALQALKDLYAVMDKIPDAQLLYVGSCAESFVLPATAKQYVNKYPCRCNVCGDRITVGDIVYWVPETKDRICARCSIKEFHGG